MSTTPTDGATGSTGQYVQFAQQWGDTESSDSSGKTVSKGSTTPGTRRTSQSFSETEPLLGKTSEKAQKLLGITSTSSDSPATKKTTGCTKEFFKGLIKEFKAKIKEFQVKHQHIQHRDQIAQNPHSAALGKTLSKFLGRVRVDMSQEKISEKLGEDMEMQTSKRNIPDMTSSDIDNLNQYFAEDNIDSGVDALVDLYKGNNLVAFQGILKALTPENREKVIDKLHQFNDGYLEASIFKAESEISESENSIDEAISSLSTASNPLEIMGHIKEIKAQAILLCPTSSSEDVKLMAELKHKSSALEQLPKGSAGRALLEKDIEALKGQIESKILEKAGIDSFDSLHELYSDPTRINSANQAIADLAKIDPDKAGRVLNKAIKQSTVKDTELMPIAKDIIGRIDSAKARAGVVAGALKQEVEDHTGGPATLLRGNSIGSKLLGQYNEKNVLPHFQNSQALQGALKKVPKEDVKDLNSETGQMEISPDNQKAIQERTSEALQILRDIALDPQNEELKIFYAMCKDVQSTVEANYGKEHASIVPMDFLFLRGINRILPTPSNIGVGVIEFEDKQQGNVTLMAKIMQSMVNKVQFGKKEPYMEPFNPFLDSDKGPLEEIRQHMLA